MGRPYPFTFYFRIESLLSFLLVFSVAFGGFDKHGGKACKYAYGILELVAPKIKACLQTWPPLIFIIAQLPRLFKSSGSPSSRHIEPCALNLPRK